MNRNHLFFFIQILSFLLMVSSPLLCELHYNNPSLSNENIVYIIDMIKMILGLAAIIGGFGFFVATSNRRTHWHPRLKRIFFGIFLFSNIVIQALFNVANISNNKKMIMLINNYFFSSLYKI